MILILLFAVTLIEGSGNVWTDGNYVWAGNPYCAENGFLLQPDSPAIDAGYLEPGLHCPTAGLNPSGCLEWFGAAPDIGACEMFYGFMQPPEAPSSVRLQ